MSTHPMPLHQLRRVRWAVRGALVLGVAASVAANVLHAQPLPVAQLIAAWPPLALLIAVELIAKVPVHRRILATARLAATAGIAAIAAWVSYWHMAGVATRYGEQGASPFLLPLSVDGLVIVASVSLVELAGRIRTADATPDPAIPSEDSLRATRLTDANADDDPVGRALEGWAETEVQREPPAEPRAAVAYWRAADPALKPAQIAAKIGRSRSTVRRILAELGDRNDAPDSGDNDAADQAVDPAQRVNGSATRLGLP